MYLCIVSGVYSEASDRFLCGKIAEVGFPGNESSDAAKAIQKAMHKVKLKEKIGLDLGKSPPIIRRYEHNFLFLAVPPFRLGPVYFAPLSGRHRRSINT